MIRLTVSCCELVGISVAGQIEWPIDNLSIDYLWLRNG
jgi:hypothetical protein